MTLLDQARQGSLEAWARFVELYHPLVYFWARKHGLEGAWAEDLTQDVFRKVVENLGQFRHNGRKGAFRAWMRTITFRLIADLFDGRQVAQAVGGSTAHERLQSLASPDETDGDEQGLSEEVTLLYHRAWKMVSSQYSARDNTIFRRVIENEEQPIAVAQDMGLTANVVSIVVSRIKKGLKDEFRDLLDQ